MARRHERDSSQLVNTSDCRSAGPQTRAGYPTYNRCSRNRDPFRTALTKLMLRPDLREFLRLAKTASLVPVVKSVSADLLTPVSAFLSVAEKEPHAFLLESVEGGEKVGRYTFLGARPYMRLVGRGDEVVLERGRHREQRTGGALQALREVLRQHRARRRTRTAALHRRRRRVLRLRHGAQPGTPSRACPGRSARARLRADVLRPPAGLRPRPPPDPHHRLGGRVARGARAAPTTAPCATSRNWNASSPAACARREPRRHPCRAREKDQAEILDHARRIPA